MGKLSRKTLIERLTQLHACQASRDWLAAQPYATAEECWHACPEPDWILWLAARTLPEATLRELAAALVRRAEPLLRKHDEWHAAHQFVRGAQRMLAMRGSPVADFSRALRHVQLAHGENGINYSRTRQRNACRRHADYVRETIPWERIAKGLTPSGIAASQARDW